MNLGKLGYASLLFGPEVNVDKVPIGGGLDVAAVVSTVAISGNNAREGEGYVLLGKNVEHHTRYP